MGNNNIRLSTSASNLCTIILPWGKYKYKRLPMEICKSLGIFQGKMNTLSQGLEYVRLYLYYLLVLRTGNWIDNLPKLKQVLIKLQEKGLKFNI